VRPHDQAPEQGLGAGLERGLAVPPGHEELLYRLGVALLALDQPDRCLARGDTWIFGPESDYEREGDVGHVVFPCGYTIGDDGDALNLYYGAADTSVALATGSIRELLRGLKPPTVW
jgi:predicted GH43/DUF377 family glycosyl hydrolase